jgi:hypothetical protein
MSKGLLFWILFVLGVLFGCFGSYQSVHGGFAYGWGMPLIEVVLIGLLGWQVFGGAIK